MDKGGQTVSATEFATITGVSRERLRTWERRFGFPTPERIARGPRRYALEDAARVVAVRRAVEHGVPLPHAIEDAARAPGFEVSAETLAGVAIAAPSAIVLVAGPEPMRFVFANGPLHAPDGPTPGQPLDALPWFAGSELERALRTLFATSTPMLEFGHPSWTDGEATARSIAYRLPRATGAPPTVAVVDVDRAAEARARSELDALRAELALLRAREQRQARALALAAIDAGIAVYMAGELALGSSSRGLLGPRMVTVTGYDDLGALMHGGEPRWLTPGSGAAFGMPASLHSLAVPIIVVGETLGVLLLVFDELRDLDEDARQLLKIVSAGLGFAMLRDRLVASARGGERESRRGGSGAAG